MDRRLALIMLAAIPFLAASFYILTGLFSPLVGFGLGLCLYWGLLAVLIFTTTTVEQRSVLLVARSPGRRITALLVVPVIGFGLIGMAALGTGVPTWLLVVIALGAIVNGLAEELFWRGALLPDVLPDNRSVILALSLFTLWHLALLAARGVTFPGGPIVLIAGAGALGAVWMASRLQTGTLGAGVLSHGGVSLFALTHLAAENLG
jgi:membrane protease YdiL (CAAX protease family)